MCAAKPPYRTRMSCDPPPPPGTQLHPPYRRPTNTRRPKHPPPRRPPRPVVKQKQPQYVDNSTSMCDDCSTRDDNANNRQELIYIGPVKQPVNGCDRVLAKPPVCRRPVAKPVAIPVAPNHGAASNRIEESPKDQSPVVPKGEAVNVNNTSRIHESKKLIGYGDVGLALTTTSRPPSPFLSDLSSHSGSNSHLNTLRLRKGSLDDDVLSRGKPVVQYVRVSKKGDVSDGGFQLATSDRSQSKSVDELDRYNIFMDLSNISCDYFYNRAFRSSFVEEVTLKRQTLGFHSDVQTLLKHSSKEKEHIYSLPQPQSYSQDTLKAVKLITDKYDTLQRRRLHAASFREGDLAKLKGTLTLHREMSAAKHRAEETISPSKSLPASPLLGVSVVESPVEDIVCLASGLFKKDMTRLEMFYKGRDTEVFVCTCLADLYLGSSALSGSVVEWCMYHRGVPVWVLNTGEGSRRRQLHLYLAERQTGFPLWQDKVNYLTNLEVHPDQPGVMTMRLSGSLSKMVRFCVKCEDAATVFFEKFWAVTSDPNDELWRVSSDKRVDKKGNGRKKKKKRKSFTKHDISQPCNFLHVSTVDPCHLRSIMTVAQIIQSRKDRETLAKRSTLTAQSQDTGVVFADAQPSDDPPS